MLAIGAAVFLSLTVGRQLLRLARQPEAFRAWIDGCGPWAPLCLIGLMCFQVVVAVLPGEPIEIGAGVAFGVWQGLGLCLIGAALGSTIIFLFTKKLGIKLVEGFVPLEKIRQLKFLQNNRRLHVLVFLLFWIPGVPKDVLTYFVGLTEMKLPAFLAISTVARIPSALMSTSGGAALGSGRYKMAVWIFVGSVALGLVGAVYYRQLVKRNSAKNAGRTRQRQSSRPLRRSSGLARGAQRVYNRRKAKRRKENMKAFSAALALCIPLMVMLLGMMMRRMQTGPSQWIGYRTRRSMQSEQVWAFAQRTAGRLWIIAGAAMLGVSAVLCVLLYQWMETAVLYFVLAQAALTLGTVPLTERALKRKFGSV